MKPCMEEHKVRYLEDYLLRTGVILEHLVRFIGDKEEIIRSCYVGDIDFSSDDFVKMILLDSCFILEVFLKYSSNSSESFEDFDATWFWLVYVDLVLLENQLPFFVIGELFSIQHCISHLRVPKKRPDRATFHFFEYFNNQRIFPHKAVQVKHFTDLLKIFQLTSTERLPSTNYIYDELRYSATQLEESGVKFKVSSSKCLIDLEFKTNLLEIPLIELSDWTETLLGNIMAFEQTGSAGDELFTAYIAMLGLLIKTAEDMDLLCDKKIVFNHLHDSSAATSLVQNLFDSIICVDQNYSICKDLNKFYERPWRTQLHIWKSTLKRVYFSNPWRSAGTITAIILLVLIFILTVCSIFIV